MATIKTDPQTTKNIIKDITTTQLCSYQLGHKYKLGKITIDRIGREHLGTEIYSRRERLAFDSMCKQIIELRFKSLTMSAIAEYLGISKSSIFTICQKIDRETEKKSAVADNEVQIISIASKTDEAVNAPSKLPSAPIIDDAHVKSESLTREPYHRWTTQRNHRYSNRIRGDYNHRNNGYIKIQFKDIQITFNPAQPEAEEVITRILSGINS